MTGWRDDLGPWKPVVEDDRLYGRGGADDGYAAFAALLAIEAAEAEGIPHARCIVLIEASEESGSPDLPAHVDHLGDRLGTPELVVCLDSGCLDTDRLWLTTSLRGMVVGRLTRRGARAGSALGSGQRHRAVQLPHPAPAARSRRGQRDRRDPASRAARRDPGRPPRPDRPHGRRARPRPGRRVPLRRRDTSDER